MMFKILYRTLIVLLAAGLISAGLYWFVGSGAGQSVLASPGGENHAKGGFDRPSPPSDGQAPAGFRERGDGEGQAGISRALSDIPVKIGTIALITALIVGLRKLISWIPRWRRPVPIGQP